MLFNSKLREEPYLDLTSLAKTWKHVGGYPGDRWCMVVVSSCREMLGQVPQRAQPLSAVASMKDGHSAETAGDNPEEGGDDVKSSCPLRLGLQACYNGQYKERRNCEVEQNSKVGLSSD